MLCNLITEKRGFHAFLGYFLNMMDFNIHKSFLLIMNTIHFSIFPVTFIWFSIKPHTLNHPTEMQLNSTNQRHTNKSFTQMNRNQFLPSTSQPSSFNGKIYAVLYVPKNESLSFYWIPLYCRSTHTHTRAARRKRTDEWNFYHNWMWTKLLCAACDLTDSIILSCRLRLDAV